METSYSVFSVVNKSGAQQLRDWQSARELLRIRDHEHLAP
jgi:hypothetical protein